MKEVFDINRFGKLLRYDFSVNRWEYILLFPISILALWLVLFMVYGNINAGDFQASSYTPIYFIGYIIMGIFLNSKSFGALKNRTSTLSYLTLPASAFEKFFLHWFLRIALFGILYPLFFYVGVNSFIPIFETGVKLYLDYKGTTASLPEIDYFNFYMVRPYTGEFFIIHFLIYFGIIFTFTLVQLGSISFGKWNLIKTFLVLIGIQILAYYYATLVGGLKGGLEELRPTFFLDGVPDNTTVIDICLMAFMVISLLICWTSTYMKLREREV